MNSGSQDIVFKYIERKFNGTNCVLIEERNLLNGWLCEIRYTAPDHQTRHLHAFVCVEWGQTIVNLLENIPDLAELILRQRVKTGGFLNNVTSLLSSVDAIAGLIAVAMVGMIIASVIVHKDGEIPQTLANSLSVILGFYFGRATNKLAATHAGGDGPSAAGRTGH